MSLNFDFSQLDKLPEGTTAKKGLKFQPKFLAKPRAGPSSSQPASAKPTSIAQPAFQPTTAAEKKQAVGKIPPTAPSTSKPTPPVELGIPSKRQIEQPTQELATAEPTRAPKRPRKQAQPLPAAAEFPGGLAIEPDRRRNAATDNETDVTGREKLRPTTSLSARAKAREDAALVPRKRGRPRKNAAAAGEEDAAVAAAAGGDQEAGPSTKTTRPLRKTTKTTYTYPSRFATEEARLKAGIRRPSRGGRDYDKGLEIDDSFLYRDEKPTKRKTTQRKNRQGAAAEEEEEFDEEDGYRYFNYTGTYEAEEDEEDEEKQIGDGAGSSKPPNASRKQKTGARKPRKTPRKGEPLSTYKTKLKKIGDDASKRKVPSLADQELDPENWSLKKIVAWAGSRERKLKAEDRKEKVKRQKDIAADIATGGTGIIPSTNGDGAGTSADAQQLHPNRDVTAAGGSGSGGGGRGRGSNQLALPTSTAVTTAGRGQQQPQLPRNANLAPQVQVVDGRIVVNRQSLTVQAQEREQYTRVVTEDTTRLNSMTYMNRISNERWTTEDTELFYKALSQFGTDFTLISHLFPGRERRHLKNKYTRENKLHPDRIDEAMNQSSNGAINSYNDMIVMLKESGMAVGAGAAAAAGVGSPSAQGAAAVLNGIPSPGGGANRSRGGGRGRNAAPLAITEAGEPASQEEEEEEEEIIIPLKSSRGGRTIRPPVK